MLVIGIDCATQPAKTGLARCEFDGDRLRVLEVRCATKWDPPKRLISEWLEGESRALLALDAPLGWPMALADALSDHRAGLAIEAGPDALFHRLTDDVIRDRFGPPAPLEVGANFIARTARAALGLLGSLRTATRPIPLVWNPSFTDSVGAIEVYPAATRRSLGAPNIAGSLRGLTRRMSLPHRWRQKSEHAVDAIVCALAGLEFLRGRAIAPDARQQATALREGWIWAGHPFPAAQPRGGNRRRTHTASTDSDTVIKSLSSPPRLWRPKELLEKPCPLHADSGLYAWYFRGLPNVPVAGCQAVKGFHLMYVGIAPMSKSSHSTIRQRICSNHLRGNASGSTLRMTLGCLLAPKLGISLQLIRGRYQFDQGEQRLSAWMEENSRVAWSPHPAPWTIEPAIINQLDLPLNLEHNTSHPFYPTLSTLRKRARHAARQA